jgi:hypothetical protein
MYRRTVMPRHVLIHPSDIEKAQLEQHPEHGYGKCEEFYRKIIVSFINSPEFKLDVAERKNRRLEYENQSLKRENLSLKQSVDHWMRQALTKVSAAGSDEGPELKTRKRRKMSAAEKKAVSAG